LAKYTYKVYPYSYHLLTEFAAIVACTEIKCEIRQRVRLTSICEIALSVTRRWNGHKAVASCPPIPSSDDAVQGQLQRSFRLIR